MEREKTSFSSIDEYIHTFPEHVQTKLADLRNLIKERVPDAQERMSWQMPTFYLHGNLVHFAAHSKHIGFYPGASGIEAFESDLSNYKHAKGSVQFPLEKPLPVKLIQRIVDFRVEENLQAMKKK